MFKPTRSRRLGLLAVLVALAIVVAWWRSVGDGDAPQSRIDLLRAAFDRASAQCYETYQGVELQACLAGVMEAHLHALGAEENAAEAGATRARLLGQSL